MRAFIDQHKIKKQNSQIYLRLIWSFCFLVSWVSLSGQVIIKGGTSFYIHDDADFHADTIIYESNETLPQTGVSTPKVYIVKGTITANLTENAEVEILYTEVAKTTPNKKKNFLAKSIKSEKIVAKSRITPIVEKEDFTISHMPDGNSDLKTGKKKMAAVTDISYNKKDLSRERSETTYVIAGLGNNSFKSYFKEKTYCSLYIGFFNARPPPFSV